MLAEDGRQDRQTGMFLRKTGRKRRKRLSPSIEGRSRQQFGCSSSPLRSHESRTADVEESRSSDRSRDYPSRSKRVKPHSSDEERTGLVKSLPTAKLTGIIVSSARLIEKVAATAGNPTGEKDELHREIRLLRAVNTELKDMLIKLSARAARAARSLV